MIALALLFGGWAAGISEMDVVGPAPARTVIVTFTNVSKEAGLSGVSGNFFSWGDYDNDGFQDLLVNGNRLFRNTGPPRFHFTETTDAVGISAPVNSGVFADFDNDGWLDIFCGGGAGSSDHPTYRDVLWRNRRDGTFREVGASEGAPWDTFPTVAAGWADVNRDGFVDLYMVNYENGTYQGYPDHFWLNDGDGTFTNMTEGMGMDESVHPYQGRGISFADLDNDGFQDGYVSNYRIMRNYLYRNNGNGTMDEVAEELGVEGHGNVHPVTRDGPYYGHSLGSSWGDLDNDGDLDLWVTNLAHKDPWRGPICDDSYLFENLGVEGGWEFLDVREGSGIEVKTIPGSLGGGDELMVSSALADYDNDGLLDLFIPQIYGDVPYAYSYLYHNEGDMTFTESGDEAGVRVWNTYGSAWCDYDKDGWMDLVTGGGVWNETAGATQGYMVHLFRNNGASEAPENEWLELELIGRESNSAAIGARAVVEVDRDGDGDFELSMIREVQGGTGAHGQQDSMVLHFGLGEVAGSIRTRVIWPMGREMVLTNVSTNGRVKVFEPTEPIVLDAGGNAVTGPDEGYSIEVTIGNPSEYPITFLELKVVQGPGEVSGVVGGATRARIEPGASMTMLLELPKEGVGSTEDVMISIGRSYPPAAFSAPLVIDMGDMPNELPIADLEGPVQAMVGEAVVFSGAGSFDPDGSITAYNFDLGDGQTSGWTAGSTISHRYTSRGTYTVSLKVRDDLEAESEAASTLIIDVAQEGTNGPTAAIVSIDPATSFQGERVYFESEGTAPPGRWISEELWTSSVDGTLSKRHSFSSDELSAGTHTIEYRVRDSSGEWSEPDTEVIEVVPRSGTVLWVTIDGPVTNGPLSGIVRFNGSSGPEGTAEHVEVRSDSGDWQRTDLFPDWSFTLDCSKIDEGVHVLEARSYGGGEYSPTASRSFEVEHMTSGLPDEKGGSEGLDSEIILDLSLLLIALALGSVLVFVALKNRRASGADRAKERERGP